MSCFVVDQNACVTSLEHIARPSERVTLSLVSVSVCHMSSASTVAPVSQTTGSWPVVKDVNHVDVTGLVHRPHSVMR